MRPGGASVPGERPAETMKGSNLFDGIASFSALLDASGQASKGKRSKRDVAEFLANQEHEILALERELRSDTYQPGRY